MKTTFKSQKLKWRKKELKALLTRPQEGDHHQTAEMVFAQIAHTGVETDLDQNLKEKPTLGEFIRSE